MSRYVMIEMIYFEFTHATKSSIIFVIIKEQARLELEKEKATEAEINKLKSVYGEKEEVVQETSGHLAAQGVYFR